MVIEVIEYAKIKGNNTAYNRVTQKQKENGEKMKKNIRQI